MSTSYFLRDRCPYDLTEPLTLHERLVDFLHEIGQEDGYWSKDATIGDLFKSDIRLAVDLKKHFKPGVELSVTEKLASLFPEQSQDYFDYSHDIMWMLKCAGIEFSAGWHIIPLENKDKRVW